MNKPIIALVVVILLVLGVTYWWSAGSAPTGEVSPLGNYFETKLVAIGTADIGQPIHGFDANLLISAFPSLVPTDFNNVETLGGHYEVSNGQVTLVREDGKPITSAESTIAQVGYTTLLNNVSRRLGVSADNEMEIDALLAILNSSDTVLTGLNKSGTALGITITPTEIVEDSRCPANANCIQAGTVRVRANLSSLASTSTQVFTLEQAVTVDDFNITLARVEPQPLVSVNIPTAGYQLYFKVEKR